MSSSLRDISYVENKDSVKKINKFQKKCGTVMRTLNDTILKDIQLKMIINSHSVVWFKI